MSRHPDNIGPRMLDILRALKYVRYQSPRLREWVRPHDIGATNGSHHSGTLMKLAERGLVRFKQRGTPEPQPGQNGHGRGNRCYQITPAGLRTLEERQ